MLLENRVSGGVPVLILNISFTVLASPVSSSTSSSLSSPGSNASPTTTTKVEQGSLVQVKTEISNDVEQQKPQPQQQVITINGQQVMVSFFDSKLWARSLTLVCCWWSYTSFL